jgi:hypothetical protein
MSIITEIVDSFKEMESPSQFYYWSALAAISAVVKDNVYLDRGGAFKTYPNIYVMLHADSGGKKGPPVNLAKRLVKEVKNTKVISGRSSIQAILKELATAVSGPNGTINAKATGFIVASEFTSAIVNDPAALTILTDLYDRNYNEGDYTSLLKSEVFRMKDPTITLLVATNEAHFDDFIGNKDFKGGFVGRMFVIVDNDIVNLNPLIRDLQIIPDEQKWIEYLKKLSLIKGPFHSIADTRAGNLYEEWYRDFYTAVRIDKLKDETGTIQRFGDSILKVAMILSLGESSDLFIQEHHILEAIARCEVFVGSIRKTTMGKGGKSSLAYQKTMIINDLINRVNNQATRKELLQRYWMHMSNEDLDSIISSFEGAGMITSSAMGGEIIYQIPDVIANELKVYFSGKNSK